MIFHFLQTTSFFFQAWLVEHPNELRTYLFRFMRDDVAPMDEWQIRVDETSVLTQDPLAVDRSRVKLVQPRSKMLDDLERRCVDAGRVRMDQLYTCLLRNAIFG